MMIDIFELLSIGHFSQPLHLILTITWSEEHMNLIHLNRSSMKNRIFYVLSVSLTAKSLGARAVPGICVVDAQEIIAEWSDLLFQQFFDP